MFRALPVGLLLALALAGCGGDGGKAISADRGESLVLAPADVGKDFIEFDKGKQLPGDLNPPRNDPERYGRQGGWKARFKRKSSAKAQTVLAIDSSADLFDSADGANKDFDLYKQYLDQYLPAKGKRLKAPDLGDEAYAITFQQGFGRSVTRYFYVAWREGIVTAAVFINGLEGRTSLDSLLSLARKQEQRIQAAAGA